MVRRNSPPPQYRALTVWLLVGQFLLQPLLSYWVTPHVAKDGHGQWVVMCTVKATKPVFVDFGADTAAESEDEYCPALQLLQLTGSAQIPLPPQAPPALVYQVGLLEQSRPSQRHASLSLGFSSRAPPIA